MNSLNKEEEANEELRIEEEEEKEKKGKERCKEHKTHHFQATIMNHLK